MPEKDFNRRKKCADCPLVGEFCRDHYEISAQQAAATNTLRSKMNTFFATMSVLGVLVAVILGFLRSDTAAIRGDMATHLSHHVTGDFRPSRDAEQRKALP